MIHSFHPEAEEELLEAVSYYEACEHGLGGEFFFEIKATIGRIIEFPELWPALDGEVRRCLARRFPFGVLYGIEEEEVFILAVMHLRRRPNYWRHRQ